MAGTDYRPGSDGEMPQIVKTQDVLGGDPRIEGHRIGVYHVYQRYVEGDDTPEEIATSYDISVAAVHAALAYAFSNPDEMRDIEARNRAIYDETAENRVVPDDAE
jgi:uncharacterized protein (DUF433 family)